MCGPCECPEFPGRAARVSALQGDLLMATLMTRRYQVSSLNPIQLLNAALDSETQELPDLVYVPPFSLVDWRNPSVPLPLRLQAAAVLLSNYAPTLDALAAAQLDRLGRDHRRSMTAALRARPAAVARLLTELSAAGRSLPEFLESTLGRLARSGAGTAQG